jgi:N-acetylglucosamine-6-phosphate deacetylase
MIEGVENLVKQVGLPLDEALRMATLYPLAPLDGTHVSVVSRSENCQPHRLDQAFTVCGTVVNGHYTTQ